MVSAPRTRRTTMTQAGTTVPPQDDVTTTKPSATPAQVAPTRNKNEGFTETLIRASTDDASIRPFEFHASDEELADLKRRINTTRWPERETVDDDTQGVRLGTIHKLADYWL